MTALSPRGSNKDGKKSAAASSSSGAAASSSGTVRQGAVPAPEPGKSENKIPSINPPAPNTDASEPPRAIQDQEEMEAPAIELPSEEDDSGKSRDSCDSMTTAHNSTKNDGAFKAEQRLDRCKVGSSRPWHAQSGKRQNKRRMRAIKHQEGLKAKTRKC